MKIHFITGATGFVGKYLAEALLEKNENVWVLVRSTTELSVEGRAQEIFGEFLHKWPTTFKFIEGDIVSINLGITDKDVAALDKHEVIFWHLAANLSFSVVNKENVQKTNCVGTANAVTFANQHAKKFIHMSTAYVCGDSLKFSENELSKGQKFRNHYERSKSEAEKFVHENCKLPYKVFRPSIIIGDAYQGKAEGCTFGYYRYTFMFYFLRKNIMKKLESGGFISRLFKLVGSSYDEGDKTLTVPWLFIPYPRNGIVDMISLDHVIESKVELYDKEFDSMAVHLTHNDPPKHRFILDSILHDVGFRKFKLLPVPPKLFAVSAKVLYFVVFPIRKYVKSVMWYIPYITTRCEFDKTVIEKHYKNPPKVSRDLIKRINEYAKENILENIEI